jgi:hypothetical protein
VRIEIVHKLTSTLTERTWRRHSGKLFLDSFSLTGHPMRVNPKGMVAEDEVAMDQVYGTLSSDYHVNLGERDASRLSQLRVI